MRGIISYYRVLEQLVALHVHRRLGVNDCSLYRRKVLIALAGCVACRVHRRIHTNPHDPLGPLVLVFNAKHRKGRKGKGRKGKNQLKLMRKLKLDAKARAGVCRPLA